MTTMTVDSNNDSYKVMVDYLFKNLENDSYNFFTNVYRYDNEFKQLLVRYVTSYQLGMSSEEEIKNLLMLKDKISYLVNKSTNYIRVQITTRFFSALLKGCSLSPTKPKSMRDSSTPNLISIAFTASARRCERRKLPFSVPVSLSA